MKKPPAGASRTREVSGQHVLELGPRRLEARRVYVRDVVTNDGDLLTRSIHPRHTRKETRQNSHLNMLLCCY